MILDDDDNTTTEEFSPSRPARAMGVMRHHINGMTSGANKVANSFKDLSKKTSNYIINNKENFKNAAISDVSSAADDYINNNDSNNNLLAQIANAEIRHSSKKVIKDAINNASDHIGKTKVGNWVKKNPKKAALIAAGTVAAAYGAKKAYDKYKERKSKMNEGYYLTETNPPMNVSPGMNSKPSFLNTIGKAALGVPHGGRVNPGKKLYDMYKAYRAKHEDYDYIVDTLNQIPLYLSENGNLFIDENVLVNYGNYLGYNDAESLIEDVAYVNNIDIDNMYIIENEVDPELLVSLSGARKEKGPVDYGKPIGKYKNPESISAPTQPTQPTQSTQPATNVQKPTSTTTATNANSNPPKQGMFSKARQWVSTHASNAANWVKNNKGKAALGTAGLAAAAYAGKKLYDRYKTKQNQGANPNVVSQKQENYDYIADTLNQIPLYLSENGNLFIDEDVLISYGNYLGYDDMGTLLEDVAYVNDTDIDSMYIV